MQQENENKERNSLLEAIRNRHSVRQYTDRPLDETVRKTLEEEIALCNAESGLHI